MRSARAQPIALLVSGLLVFCAAASAAADAARDRALRDVVGSVESVRQTTVAEGDVWLEITLRTRQGEAVEARVAPLDVLRANDFRVEIGDTARVRVFSDEQPAGVSRIRNLSTGQTLRLRCLSGNPIWSLREPAMTGADRGSRRAGRGPS